MASYERFLIGFVSALLYPSIKATQNNLEVTSMSAVIGAVLPFSVIGVLVGLYAVLVEGNENDRGKLFKICLALPALIIGLASSPIESSAQAEPKEVFCRPISDFERGFYDAISAITGQKRPHYYLLTRKKIDAEYLMIDEKEFFIVGKFDKRPETGLLFDVDKCELL